MINFSSLSSQYLTHSLTNLLWWAHWAIIWLFLGCNSVCAYTDLFLDLIVAKCKDMNRNKALDVGLFKAFGDTVGSKIDKNSK